MFFAKNAFSLTFVMTYLPSLVTTITSSMSEQSHTNSSLRMAGPIPKKPSARSTYSLAFATTTFVASIESNSRSSVLRSRPRPYFSLIRRK